jgi:alkylation response protein AidB-like acyl-CoA dehydrogenase
MNVDFTDEQLMLKEGLARRTTAASGLRTASADERWQEYAEAGFLAMPFSEEAGGLGAGPVETMIFMEEMGRAAISDAFLSTIVFAGEVLRCAKGSVAASLIEDIIQGGAKVVLAHDELSSMTDVRLNTVATKNGETWQLSGKKRFVLDLAEADFALVTSRSTNPVSDIQVFLVDLKSKGVIISELEGWDGRHLGHLGLDQVEVPESARLEFDKATSKVLNQAWDVATAAICAEAVGLMSAAFEMTVEYLKTRRQFKTTLSSFQSLRHRVADMLMDVEMARSASMAASSACLSDDESARRRAVSTAKVQINRCGRRVGQEAVQFHGAIGLCEEYQLGAFFKRLTMIGQTFGDDRSHMEYLCAQGVRG